MGEAQTIVATDREAFLADRRKGIGGSDLAAIVGIDPKKTAYQLWREKLGLPADDQGKPFARRRGNFLEPAILAKYAATVQPATLERGIAHATDGGWRRGNQDARATMPDGVRKVVEAKSVNRNVARSDWGDPWSDEVPDRALCQGLWYGGLDDADIVDFAVLVIPDDPDEVLGLTPDEVVAASEFRIYQARRNRDVESWLVDEARAFWFGNVQERVPPEVRNEEDVDLRWPTHNVGKTKPAEPVLALLREYAEVSERANADKKHREHLREQLLLYAQGDEALVAPDGRTPWLTMTVEPRAGYVVAPTTSRVLRLTKWWKKAQPQTTPNKQEN